MLWQFQMPAYPCVIERTQEKGGLTTAPFALACCERLFLIEPFRDDAADRAAYDWCDPEQPERSPCLRAAEDRGRGRARRIKRRVRHRNRDEMEQGQREPDRNRHETRGAVFGRDAEDHDQEQRSDDD